MRTFTTTIDLDATPGRVSGFVTAAYAYDKPHRARCSSVDAVTSFADEPRPAAQAPDALLT
jgi:hypothetical protein